LGLDSAPPEARQSSLEKCHSTRVELIPAVDWRCEMNKQVIVYTQSG
jgi:hypothetical protein